ncbi:MAG: hypothetical protein PHT95_00480 [Candidatus Omnitrophica bacterium]|nr:hypothetical protein [Candidatus Omnitrophota bacterium]MDD4012727.1 hypothetical protein [Candidatus Omnitrophota bacterium]
MNEKKYLQACQIGGSIYGKKRVDGMREMGGRDAVSKEDLMTVYNKFYKNQVAALYKIIREDK